MLMNNWAHPYRDRYEAGRTLAELLQEYRGREEVIVLALPRGGVPVGYEIARALGVPLDVFIVRKLGVPGHEELAMGATASGNVTVVNREVVDELRIPQSELQRVQAREAKEIARRESLYRDSRPRPGIEGKTVILVDDGLATGSTMRAAIEAVRKRNPKQVIMAVPAASEETCNAFRKEADDVICAITPDPFVAVGLWYEDFSPTTDEEVRELLNKAAEEEPVHHR